jgi:hypothetical protein
LVSEEELLGPRARLGLKDRTAHRVKMAKTVLPVIKGHQAFKVLLDHKDQPALREIPAQLDLEGLRGP